MARGYSRDLCKRLLQAEAAGFSERYVRERLGTMVTSGIVDYDPIAGTYVLPPGHAAWLTRGDGTNNLALRAQYIPLLAQVEQLLIDTFRHGGGVPYTLFPCFQRPMAEESVAVHDAALVDTILPLVPGLPKQLRAEIEVVDVGCGQGHAINLMAQAFPASRFCGYGFSKEGVRAGRAEG